jgi:hypothetical protein
VTRSEPGASIGRVSTELEVHPAERDDPRLAALELLGHAAAHGVTLRATGGIAVAILCSSAGEEPLRRSYKDLDLVGPSRQRDAIDELMKRSGYAANEEFNSLHGARQMLYVDARGRVLDVFIDRIVMCHALDVSRRLELYDHTLSPEDLLLTKLQVIQATDSDLKDAVALLADHELDGERIAGVLAADWGWWRTVTETLGKVRDYNAGLEGFVGRTRVAGAISALETAIERAPKGMRWRMRARVGDRVPWYLTPEEE